MRDMLAHADLARYAGQFVWLELNLDNGGNRKFFSTHKISATPTFFIIEPEDENVAADQSGAMSFGELTQFLDRGGSGLTAKASKSADASLAHADALLAQSPAEAVRAYRETLRMAPAAWARREVAQASLVAALQAAEQWQSCGETAATFAAKMKQEPIFARVVVSGMWCVVQGDPAPWSKDAARKMEPLAQKALSLPGTVQDHRNELYRTLMFLSLAQNDTASAARWGDLWLKELDAITPASDEERSGMDIARVENVQIYGDPARILPALLNSERAMPKSYNASLRVAQMEAAVKQYSQAVAACDRGLARSPGPAGQSWLLQVKADSLAKQGKAVEAQQALEAALEAAQQIPAQSMRDNNIAKIRKMLRQQ